ncbi:hypothetical protein EDC01DRAFT_778839 [Geopyxis carbonaria]|nr:hypothetical protein EDC01DRAFT_778839 [Geopyxis carbonaria]
MHTHTHTSSAGAAPAPVRYLYSHPAAEGVSPRPSHDKTTVDINRSRNVVSRAGEATRDWQPVPAAAATPALDSDGAPSRVPAPVGVRSIKPEPPLLPRGNGPVEAEEECDCGSETEWGANMGAAPARIYSHRQPYLPPLARKIKINGFKSRCPVENLATWPDAWVGMDPPEHRPPRYSLLSRIPGPGSVGVEGKAVDSILGQTTISGRAA